MLLKIIPIAAIAMLLSVSEAEIPSENTNLTLYLDLSSGQYHSGILEGYSQLVTLNLSDNNLKHLPVSIADMNSLKKLYLHGNPGLDIASVIKVLSPKLDFNLTKW